MKYEQVKKIKAALYAAGNEDKLIKQAIMDYRDPSKEEHLENVSIRVNGKSVKIKNVPGIKVDGEIRGNLRLLATIESVLSEMDNVPDSIGFFELLD